MADLTLMGSGGLSVCSLNYSPPPEVNLLEIPVSGKFLGMLTDMKTKKDPDDLGGLTGRNPRCLRPFYPNWG